MLSAPIELPVWSTGVVHEFDTPQALSNWADAEATAWLTERKPTTPQLAETWRKQSDSFANLRAISDAYGRQLEIDAADEDGQSRSAFYNAAATTLEYIRTGALLTTDHSRYADMRALADVDPDAAALLLIASVESARRNIQQLINQHAMPYEVLIRAALSRRLDLDQSAAIEAHTKSFQLIKTRGAKAAKALDGLHVDWQRARSAAESEEADLQASRSHAWNAKLEEVSAQWEDRLKVYDEKMALAAPSTYWKRRSKIAIISAIAYSVAFVSVVAVATYYFIDKGIPYLTMVAKPGVSVVTAILPVLVPTFVGIWILRILGRQMSENLHLVQDASERVTMVMTFLALMNDEVRGKALVTDDDRLLILHSLFRPSSISAHDDAPPVHWFDILSRKFGGPGRPG